MFGLDLSLFLQVVGQLFFGYLSDKWSRKDSLLISTIILIIFTALAAGSYYHGDPVGMFNILTAWRFFVGIGIGGKNTAKNQVTSAGLKHKCRRVSSRQRKLRRIQRRAEGRYSEYLVYLVHKLDDRLGFRLRGICAIRRCRCSP